MSSSSLLSLVIFLACACVCVMAHPHAHGGDGHGVGNKHSHGHGHGLFPAQLHHAKGFVPDYHPVAIEPYDAADPVTYYSWHVHVYFLQHNTGEIASATALRNEFIKTFNVTACNDECGALCPLLCHWDLNLVPMGPHPIGSFGFYIPLDNYLTTLTWFNQRAESSGLRILFHPNSGYVVIDHRDRGIWMKQILPLDLSQL